MSISSGFIFLFVLVSVFYIKGFPQCLVILGCQLIFKSEELKSVLEFCVQNVVRFFNWSQYSSLGFFREYPHIQLPREEASNLLQGKGDDNSIMAASVLGVE